MADNPVIIPDHIVRSEPDHVAPYQSLPAGVRRDGDVIQTSTDAPDRGAPNELARNKIPQRANRVNERSTQDAAISAANRVEDEAEEHSVRLKALARTAKAAELAKKRRVEDETDEENYQQNLIAAGKKQHQTRTEPDYVQPIVSKPILRE